MPIVTQKASKPPAGTLRSTDRFETIDCSEQRPPAQNLKALRDSVLGSVATGMPPSIALVGSTRVVGDFRKALLGFARVTRTKPAPPKGARSPTISLRRRSVENESRTRYLSRNCNASAITQPRTAVHRADSTAYDRSSCKYDH